MLRELIVDNFALIEHLELSLGPGLTCLTGETGAGKSVLVGTISAVLGARMGPEVARAGRQTAVQASFDISGVDGLAEMLDGLGMPGDGELIIKRVVPESGRGKVYINGTLASLSVLQEVGERLVDIHGQHEHQSLLKVDTHIDVLDEYLGLGRARAAYETVYGALAGYKKRLAELTGRERERAQRLDMVRFQIAEIKAAGLSPGEEEELVAERAVLANSEKLQGLAASALEGLSDSDTSALANLGEALKAAQEIASVVPGQDEMKRLLETAHTYASEAGMALRAFADSVEADPSRLDELQERLSLIGALKKKYGSSVEDVLMYAEELDAELFDLERGEAELSGLAEKIKEQEDVVRDLGEKLSAARAESAKELCGKAVAEFGGLGMDKARIEVRFTRLDEPGPRGLESAEFLFSANPGEEPKPLSRVASGGELSRVMLALKVILAGADRVPTLIFDEVDSGVGGRTAGAVGKKLKEAAAARQVLCVTHLPQIASLASEHYLVGKSVEGGVTKVTVERLDRQARVDEIARMLGGKKGSKTASAHAEELVVQGETNG